MSILSLRNVNMDEDMRLTFPFRNGCILPPFRLRHDAHLNNFEFELKQSVYDNLMYRPDFEVELNSVHCYKRTQWPSNVKVSVNTIPLRIGEDGLPHKPFSVKRVCRPGRNIIDIRVTGCFCSHVFVLQFVHRPTLPHILQNFLMPLDRCVAKMKRSFQAHISAENALRDTSFLKVSLQCAITFKRLILPTRGDECEHAQCFDLETYIQANSVQETWLCPVCLKSVSIDHIEIDQYMWGILQTLSRYIEFIVVDAGANWRPILPLDKKVSNFEKNRQTISTSPRDTMVPQWDNSQTVYRYMYPDINSIVSGNMTTLGELPSVSSTHNKSDCSQTASNGNMSSSLSSGNNALENNNMSHNKNSTNNCNDNLETSLIDENPNDGLSMAELLADLKALNKVSNFEKNRQTISTSPRDTMVPQWDNSQTVYRYMYPDINSIVSGNMTTLGELPSVSSTHNKSDCSQTASNGNMSSSLSSGNNALENNNMSHNKNSTNNCNDNLETSLIDENPNDGLSMAELLADLKALNDRAEKRALFDGAD